MCVCVCVCGCVCVCVRVREKGRNARMNILNARLPLVIGISVFVGHCTFLAFLISIYNCVIASLLIVAFWVVVSKSTLLRRERERMEILVGVSPYTMQSHVGCAVLGSRGTSQGTPSVHSCC
jgi:uncharacterized membrane protein